ncbi:MAG: hypothetical protein ACQEP8_02040 [Chlamydiota bacterium]
MTDLLEEEDTSFFGNLFDEGTAEKVKSSDTDQSKEVDAPPEGPPPSPPDIDEPPNRPPPTRSVAVIALNLQEIFGNNIDASKVETSFAQGVNAVNKTTIDRTIKTLEDVSNELQDKLDVGEKAEIPKALRVPFNYFLDVDLLSSSDTVDTASLLAIVNTMKAMLEEARAK